MRKKSVSASLLLLQRLLFPSTLLCLYSKYNVDDEELEMTMEQFQEKFGLAPSREALTMLVGKIDDASDRVLVYFPEGDIGVKECKPCVTRILQ